MTRWLESKWTTLALGVVATTALVLAVTAIQSERELRDSWIEFQDDYDQVSMELADALRLASVQLGALSEGTLVFEVDVDEEIPIEATVPFSRELIIPVNTAIPINEEIDTTIEVDGPLGITVPVDVRVPIDLEVPVDLAIPFTVEETIDVSTSTRIQLSVPIEIDVAATDIAPLAEQFSRELASLADTIEGAG